jgi:rhodanese-related sulfurtransferase
MGSLLSNRTAPEGSRRDATSPPSADELLERARLRLTRITATQAAAEQKEGALLVDIRSSEQRQKDGRIPGALVIERTVLEWRLDPASDSRLQQAADHEVRVILICAQGYSSSLAAASLQDLGLVNATDVIAGFDAWAAAGLPIER